MKKELTLKELSELTNIAIGTLRSWTLKPINGVAYDSKAINVVALFDGLKRYFKSEYDFEEKFGFQIEDIVIIKSERTSKKYLSIEDFETLLSETKVKIHNYALVTEANFIQKVLLRNEEVLYVFKLEKGYKTFTVDEISRDNIKIEKVED